MQFLRTVDADGEHSFDVRCPAWPGDQRQIRAGAGGEECRNGCGKGGQVGYDCGGPEKNQVNRGQGGGAPLEVVGKFQEKTAGIGDSGPSETDAGPDIPVFFR